MSFSACGRRQQGARELGQEVQTQTLGIGEQVGSCFLPPSWVPTILSSLLTRFLESQGLSSRVAGAVRSAVTSQELSWSSGGGEAGGAGLVCSLRLLTRGLLTVGYCEPCCPSAPGNFHFESLFILRVNHTPPCFSAFVPPGSRSLGGTHCSVRGEQSAGAPSSAASLQSPGLSRLSPGAQFCRHGAQPSSVAVVAQQANCRQEHSLLSGFFS